MRASLFFHCQTSLIGEFENLFAAGMRFFDNREIRLRLDEPLPTEALRFCFAQALTYHRRRA